MSKASHAAVTLTHARYGGVPSGSGTEPLGAEVQTGGTHSGEQAPTSGPPMCPVGLQQEPQSPLVNTLGWGSLGGSAIYTYDAWLRLRSGSHSSWVQAPHGVPC